MRRVTTSWRVIEDVLREHAHSIFQALHAPACPAAVNELEEWIGARFPRSFVASLGIHDGMRYQVNLVDNHSLLPVAGMSGQWRMIRGFPWERPGPEFVDDGRIKGDLRWRRAWVPIVVDLGGNLLGFDLDPGPTGTSSQVFAWQNWGASAPKVVASSYAAWLDQIAEQLLERRFTLDRWRHIHLEQRMR